MYIKILKKKGEQDESKPTRRLPSSDRDSGGGVLERGIRRKRKKIYEREKKGWNETVEGNKMEEKKKH